MEFGSRLYAICFICIGFIQVVTGIDITIDRSSMYYSNEAFTFTCGFNTTATAVRILQKDGVKVQSVQLSGSDCYNVELAVPQICDPLFCSCSQQGNIFTASWNFTISSTSLWKCVEGSSQSQELLIKPAGACETVTLTKDSQLNAGKETTLICVTNECRPRAYVQWYIGSQNYTLEQSDTVKVTNSTEDLTYVESKLKVILKRDFDNQIVKCLAWNIRPTTYVTTNFTLTVQGVETTTVTTTNVETTTTSQTTTELITTSTEPQTSPKRETTDSVTSTTEAKTTRSYSETTTKPLTSYLPEGGQTTIKSTTTLEAESSSSSTNTVYTSTTKPSGSPLAGEEIIIITVCSVVGFIIILFIVIIVMFAMYKRRKTPIEKHHKQEHTNKFHKQQEKKDKPVKTFDDFHALENRNKYERENERHITHFKYSNKRKKTTSSYQHPRGYDHNKYNNRNTISTYYPRMYGGSHNYGFDWETSPYEQNYQYYTGSTPRSSYYDQQKHQEKCLGGHHHRSLGGHHHGRSSERHHRRSSERHHGRYQRTHYQSYPAASYHYFPNDQY